MFDFFSPVTDLFSTIATWIGYGLVATFIVGALFLLVALPIAMKMAAVAFARVLIVETSNLIAQSGISKQVSNAVQSVNDAAKKITDELENNKLNTNAIRVIELEKEKVM